MIVPEVGRSMLRRAKMFLQGMLMKADFLIFDKERKHSSMALAFPERMHDFNLERLKHISLFPENIK